MEILISFILPFVLLLTVVVFIHEYGHYYFAKKYGVVVVPTIIIFEYDEEVYRYQADLSFKLSATKEEVQDYIDELVLGDF